MIVGKETYAIVATKKIVIEGTTYAKGEIITSGKRADLKTSDMLESNQGFALKKICVQEC
jgi:hypothetical protein